MNHAVTSRSSSTHCFVFGSSVFGGHEMMASRIAEAAAERAAVRIIASSRHHEKIREITRDRVEVVALDHVERRFESITGFLNPRVYWALAELHRKTHGCETVVAVNGGLTANHALTLALSLLCRTGNPRAVLYYPMLHSAEEVGLAGWRAKNFSAAQERVMARIHDFATIDAIWRDRLLARSGRSLDIAVIHNFVARPADRPAFPRPPRSPSDPLRLCFLGRLDRQQKGLDLLVDVAAKLAADSQAPRIHFGIIGDGPDGAELRIQCERVATSRVSFEFHGWQEQPAALLASHDALILPSRAEGVPTVIIEALNAGLQVFAFAIPGMDRLLPPGDLVPTFDTRAMANLIQERSRQPLPAPAVNAYVQMLGDRQRFVDEVSRVLIDPRKSSKDRSP